MRFEMKIRNGLKKIGKLFGNDRGTWAGIAIATIGAVGTAGAGYLSGMGGDGGDGGGGMSLEDLLVYKQLPDYPEATGARESWWSKLQEWGKQPGYGAISPEWDETWRQAKEKLTQYYWGGVNDTGLAGKIGASAARRNVSQSPALENMLTSMGMQEAQDVRGLAGTEAINKAQFAETGRQNWLNSIMNLTQMKPNYITSAGAVGPAVAAMYGNAQQGDTGLASIISSLGGLLGQSGGGGGGDSGITNLIRSLFSSGGSQSSLLSGMGSAGGGGYVPQSQGGLTEYFNQNYGGYNF